MTAVMVLCVQLTACGSGNVNEGGRTELVVSVAASLSEVAKAVAKDYQTSHPTVSITLNNGASGTLAQQILQGAGVDLFISAAEREMDLLQREGRIETATRRDLAGNRLVLVAPADDPQLRGFPDLASERVRRVAMGAPESVPAGAYAREALRTIGLWEEMSGKVIFASSVRQALTYAERGEVDAALVYRTDALNARGIRVVAEAPPESHRPIRYPAALVAGRPHRETAAGFLEYLAGAEAAERFRAYGFSPTPAPAPVPTPAAR